MSPNQYYYSPCIARSPQDATEGGERNNLKQNNSMNHQMGLKLTLAISRHLQYQVTTNLILLCQLLTENKSTLVVRKQKVMQILKIEINLTQNKSLNHDHQMGLKLTLTISKQENLLCQLNSLIATIHWKYLQLQFYYIISIFYHSKKIAIYPLMS